MKSLDCNQIKIFINLKIIEEDKYKKIIFIFFKILKKKKIMQFSVATWCNHEFYANYFLIN